MRTFGVKSVILSEISIRKRPHFPPTYAPCSELPSTVSAMGRTFKEEISPKHTDKWVIHIPQFGAKKKIN